MWKCQPQVLTTWHQSEAIFSGGPHAPVNMAESIEEVNVGGKKRRKWHVCCAVLRYISYAKFSQILEVLRDFHRLFGSRNSPTTGILQRHVYRSVWPARGAKPRSGAALEGSAHDCDTGLYPCCIDSKTCPDLCYEVPYHRNWRDIWTATFNNSHWQ